MRAFPLQHKKLQRLTLPYMQVGTCEVMNLATSYNMDSFNVFNPKNSSFYTQSNAAPSTVASATPSFLGEMVGGGLLDSYAGRDASTFIGNYLARALSMHTVLPAELRALRQENASDPLLEVMMAGLRRRRAMGVDLTSLMTEWDFQQYAMSADAAFFSACNASRRGQRATPAAAAAEGVEREATHMSASTAAASSSGPARPLPAEETGCRGVWFSATVAPTSLEVQQRRALTERRQQLAPPPQKTLVSAEAAEERYVQQLLAQAPFCLDVTVGCVGNSRAFGVARNVLTDGMTSALDPTRERTAPLSVDHTPLRTTEFRRITQAGGKVDSAVGDVIDGNPFMNVSRSFGHWSMKNNARRSPAEQKMIALPSVKSWRMLAGDALVLCNHAVFETRHQDDSSMDELAKVVGRGLSAGLSAEAIAASLCDFAIRFGSEHSLQVMVAVSTSPATDGSKAASHAPEREVATMPPASPSPCEESAAPAFAEWVEPGPLYIGACQQYPEFRHALALDCARCDMALSTLIRKRWERVRELLPLRHTLFLLPYYGRECGVLQQVMDEEAHFFEREGLLDVTDVADPKLDEVFRKLAKRLQAGGGKQKST